MMYSDKFVAVIKHNGKICREHGGVVYLPFGSEYEIGLKNLHTTSAVVSVTIDGEDVLDNNRLVVRPNTSTTLEGFMKGTAVRNRFRFIKKTKRIEQYRGNRIDDGIVRVEFRFEKEVIDQPLVKKCLHYHYHYNTYYDGTGLSSPTPFTTDVTCCTRDTDDGITVRGSETCVDYIYADVGPLEAARHSIVLMLRGKTHRKVVKKPLMVKSKLKCGICGKVNKSTHKYCGECGAYLL